MDTFLATLFLIVCILLIIVVLLQKGRGGGLSGAFGGAGSSAFGTRTGDVFTWVTIVLAGVFLLLAIGVTLRFRPPENQQVQPPRFIPTPRAIDKPISVTIQPVTPRSEIFFTLDGSAPTRRSMLYEAAVLIRPDTTIKARAYLRGWKASEVATGTYPGVLATQPTSAPTSGPG